MPLLTRASHYFSQLYNKLMPIPCQLCGQRCIDEPVCLSCQADLPTLDTACPRCATPLDSPQICGNCLSHPPFQNTTLSAFIYQEPVDQLIIDFKFHRHLHLTRFFVSAMVKKVDLKSLPEVLIPIPLHPHRLRERGYNQSFELARELSKCLSIPVGHQYLSRIIDTPPQATLPLKQRKKNMQHAFKLNQTPVPAHIALIDDVFTTGQTANEAAKLFHHAGCQHIEVWTIARTIRHD